MLIFDLLADLGESAVVGLREFYRGVSFLGEVVATLVRIIVTPARFRLTSLVYHMESIGLRSAPIIILINFLVGGIVAQQGIFQLQRFGASSYAVDLIGILVLRELGVLFGKGGFFGNELRIKPPMCITKDDADYLVAMLDEVLGEIAAVK